MNELPLFPLHTVLCPGVALPLHIFEERYRLMIGRCIDNAEPFGVVLIRAGQEVGDAPTQLSQVGTTALIREAGRYPDGRMDLMTVGGNRFRIERVDTTAQPYLVGHVSYLDEPLGDEAVVGRYAERVRHRFLSYLELLQPALGESDGQPEVEIEIEIETEGEAEETAPEEAGVSGLIVSAGEEGAPSVRGTDEERRELLMAAARRLTAAGDPTTLSYVISGLVQVELPTRQLLLEAPDTSTRLRRLDGILAREIQLLGAGLKPLLLDSKRNGLRRN